MKNDLCALCRKAEPDKTNTHYLTDAIIRTCLNLDGTNGREEGLYFDVSSDSPFIDFNFQRGTSVTKLEERLGRSATEEEIEKAKQIPFSVDHVFCTNCEKIFTEIENKFTQNILAKHRSVNLDGIVSLEFKDNEAVDYRMFMYLQIWRTSICEEQFNISEEAKESLRNTILNFRDVTLDSIPEYPIVVTYLQTTGEEAEYTRNLVGCTNDRNPNFLLMNDFVVQFFDSVEDVKQVEFYGMNKYISFNDFVNDDTSKIIVKVVPNQVRLEILDNITKVEQVQRTLVFLEEYFKHMWAQIFQGATPHTSIISRYKVHMTSGDFDVLAYTPDSIALKTKEFMEAILK